MIQINFKNIHFNYFNFNFKNIHFNYLFHFLAAGFKGSSQKADKYISQNCPTNSARNANTINKETLYETNLCDNKNSQYIKWSANQQCNNEHQTYAGYLRKRGALFKQWNERYFVLDSIKHQVINFSSQKF